MLSRIEQLRRDISGEVGPKEKKVNLALEKLGWGDEGDNTSLAVVKAIETISITDLDDSEFALSRVLDGKRRIKPEEVEELRQAGPKLIKRALLSPDVDKEGFRRLGFENKK